MKNKKIERVVVVGGGTAGWITTSLLIKLLGKSINFTLIESDKIGIVGVGEATIPPIIHLNNALGIKEHEFLKATKGTIKLGIQFDNWTEQGSSYMHAFGEIGKNFPFCDFHHFWIKAQQQGIESSYWDYSFNYQAAINNKFRHTNKIEGTELAGLAYAYHFDATLYANFLRERCLKFGANRVEGIIDKVNQDPDSGHVTSVELANGKTIEGDLFIDCSGLHALLTDKTLNTGFEDWSHWLPCDRAVAVQCENVEPILPYTKSIAHHVGWQWRIPLQHRIGNGLVYSSKYMSDEEAKELLLDNLDGKPLAEPRVIKFRTGRRIKQWDKNVVSVGLSSGFLEPLESTSIHLIQSAATRLAKLFPHNGIKQIEVDEFNAQSKSEFERIRDFIILHYKLNNRKDSKFWLDCKNMDIPESLEKKMKLFEQTARVFREDEELFTEIAWQQVMIGQGLTPSDHHPIADALSDDQLRDLLQSIKSIIDGAVEKLPTHDSFIKQNYPN